MNITVLIIACGAIAREMVEIKRLYCWSHLEIQCLPAGLHNTPERIPGAVRDLLKDNRDQFNRIFVAFADCGTGGQLDKVLNEYDVQRLPGAHC